ncbi:hydantoinase B/oxoprolinase family protein [Shinella daejeonensis]|nr:hydantoinase B/oxoprolinase family protein [Shinella daejeonensis]
MEISLTGAELAILRHRIEGVNKKMANTVVRTGRSGVLNRARDFSVCILTADCDLLSAAEGLPIHTLCGPDMMARWMLTFHPNLKRGDAFLHNSPYHGNSHAADQVVLVPVFDDEEVHRFTVVVKAHQADIGNSVPTTLHATARDIYEEGAMIFPSVRLQENFKFNEDLIRMCRMRIRVPDQWYGDLLATLGAARIGERELIALGREIGWAKLLSFPAKWFEYSENRMMEALRKMTSGQAEALSIHDAFPGTTADGIEIRASVRVDAEDARVHVDFTGCPDCLPNGLNLTEATSRTAAMVGIFNSIDSSVPKNAGSIRRIMIDLRENAIVGIPHHPTSCSLATTNIADHATNCVQMAIAAISEGSGMAETGYAFSPTTGTISGIDPRNGKPFVNMVFLGHTAGAATGHGDRWLTLLHVGNGGLCNIDGAELTELYHPVVIRERKLVTDSEGAGKFIGASSMLVEYGPVGGDLELVFASDGTDHAPQGVRGGKPGGKADQYIRFPSGELKQLDKVARVILREGDTTVGIACGGGGYGSPFERDPQTVANDVLEKWISRERAEKIYGVAIDADGSVNREKTQTLREAVCK